MAWGIMMTVVTMVGMFGVAIFEVTSGNAASSKPDTKHRAAMPAGKEVKKAA
jgi:hypothetical protein